MPRHRLHWAGTTGLRSLIAAECCSAVMTPIEIAQPRIVSAVFLVHIHLEILTSLLCRLGRPLARQQRNTGDGHLPTLIPHPSGPRITL